MLNGLRSLLHRGGRHANRRCEPRRLVSDGTIRIFDETYPVADWSASGFRAAPCDLEQEVGNEVPVTLSVRLTDKQYEFSCRALVVRVNTEVEEVAGMFVMMDRTTRATIAEEFGIFAPA